jgi:hypothetical protein
MFCVAAVEIGTAACTGTEAEMAAKAADAARLPIIFSPTLSDRSQEAAE